MPMDIIQFEKLELYKDESKEITCIEVYFCQHSEFGDSANSSNIVGSKSLICPKIYDAGFMTNGIT